MIDLRSDTVTVPTAAMRKTMAEAEVGDDVFAEDPTVKKLEAYTAELFGKEAAVYCPSGTMTNQIAIKIHTQPGDELLCDVNAHIYNYEGGGISFNSGVQAKLLKGDEGRLDVVQIMENINGHQDWLTRTSLVSLENTVNRAGGSYYTLDQIRPIADLCKKQKLALHLDGARIFNALAETGESPAEVGACFDTVSVCLSKGLGAPIGSLLLGSRDHIAAARRVRKVFGGGMRQAGILAAAGLHALKYHIPDLRTDHRRAKRLAEVISTLPYVESMLPVYTNILIFRLRDEMPGDAFERALRDRGIRVSAFGRQTIRMVTHRDLDDSMIESAVTALKALAAG